VDPQGELDMKLMESMVALPPELDPLETFFGGGISNVPAFPSDGEKLAWMQRGKTRLEELYRKGLYEQGLQHLERMDSVGTGGEFNLLKAVLQERLGQDEQALNSYAQALRSGLPQDSGWGGAAQSQFCDLLVRKAIQAYEQGNHEDGLELLKKAETMDPERRDVAFNLGCFYLREKEPEKALDSFARYLDLTPADSARKVLTQKAVEIQRKQIASSGSVRQEQKGYAVDLVFEKPLSLGELLSPGGGGMNSSSEQKEFLDRVLLAPYWENRLEKERSDPAPLSKVRTQ
jgi:tetratricopeptide (TPR) repeat protein